MISFVTYRTKLLSEKQASAFAAALRANSRFAMVSVERSSRARGEKAFIVRFEPSNAARKEALVNNAQDQRTERALTQSFTFCRDTDHDFCHCLSHSGEVYETTLNSCSCPDETYRCSGVGLACKHRIALALAIRAGDVQEFRHVVTPQRHRLDQDRFHEIFA